MFFFPVDMCINCRVRKCAAVSLCPPWHEQGSELPWSLQHHSTLLVCLQANLFGTFYIPRLPHFPSLPTKEKNNLCSFIFAAFCQNLSTPVSSRRLVERSTLSWCCLPVRWLLPVMWILAAFSALICHYGELPCGDIMDWLGGLVYQMKGTEVCWINERG